MRNAGQTLLKFTLLIGNIGCKKFGAVETTGRNPNSRQITNQTSATLTGLEKKTYYLSIRAKNATGFSPYATEVVLNPSSIKEN